MVMTAKGTNNQEMIKNTKNKKKYGKQWVTLTLKKVDNNIINIRKKVIK